MNQMSFPAGFSFGTATASAQIEGALDVDGRIPSIWDTFCATPGNVAGGHDISVACDHYRRFRDDVALMRELGMQTYRFSVAWPRVMDAEGRPNDAGLAFYSDLVDELHGAGIRPWVTLYHWDLPQHLEDAGGWTVRSTAEAFAEYAATVYDALGDRVDVWTTLNEPWCSAFLGYGSGEHAPGIQDPRASLLAVHHLLLGHGLAVGRLRQLGATPGNGKQVGITLNPSVVDPADPANPADVDAARRLDGLRNRIWLDPLFSGRYPEDVAVDMGDLLWPGEAILAGDLDIISAPIEVLGVNFYNAEVVRGAHGEEPRAAAVGPSGKRLSAPHPHTDDIVHVSRDLPVTAMGWEVNGPDLGRLLRRLDDEWTARAGTFLAVTENGAAYDDVPNADDFVADSDRIDYLSQHIAAVADAVAAGVDVRAYLQWSLLDNFEWAWGYDKRFGIVRVDFETQARTPKASARWYSRLIQEHLESSAEQD